MKNLLLILSFLWILNLHSQNKSDKSPRERIQEITATIKNSPNESWETLYIARGLAWEELGNYKEAIDDYKLARTLMKEECDLCTENIANAMYKMNDYHAAIREYTKLIDKNNFLVDQLVLFYFQRGFCKYKVDDIRGAIQDYNKVIEFQPKHKEAFYNRGCARYFINQKNEACLDWSEAGELGMDEAYIQIKKYCN